MTESTSPGARHRLYHTTSRAVRLRTALAGLAILGAAAGTGIALAAPSAAAVTCTPTGFVQDGLNLTAASIDPEAGSFDNTIVDASGCNIGIYFDKAGSVSGVTITGSPNYYGILVNGVNVSVTDSHVNSIHDSPNLSGAQHGIGIGYRNGASGTISGNEVTDYQKGGILVSNLPGNTGAPSTATVSGNTVTGIGPTEVIAQNGIQISFQSTATVTGNTVSDNFYTPTSFVACGLLFFEANGVRQSENTFSGNERNLCNAGRGGGHINS